MTAGPLAALLAAVLGWGVGHGLRRALPHLLGLKAKEMPFGGPWTEVATALGFVSLGWLLGLGPLTAPWYVFTALLIGICATDYMVKLIPDRLTFIGAGLGLLWNGFFPGHIRDLPFHTLGLQAFGLDPAAPWAGILLALGGAGIGFVTLESIRRLFGLAANMQVMGMGDSKLLLMIGAFLGPSGALLSLMLSFLLGVPHGLVYLKLMRQPHSPFGPPLAASAWSILLFRREIVEGILAFQGAVIALPLEILAAGYTLLLSIAALLLWRTRRRAAQYEALIEEDYRQVEERLEDL